MELERRETPGILVFRLIYPCLIYFGLSILVQIAMVIPQCVDIVKNSVGMGYSELANRINDHIYSQAMMLTAVSGAVVIPVLYFFYARDRGAWPVAGFFGLEPIAARQYGIAALLGAASCMAFNHLISLFRIAEASSVYVRVEEAISNTPFFWQFLATVVAAPLSEELVFRGLLYKRLRRCAGAPVCALVSAMAFGLTHGNLVQFVYAFIEGMLLAFVYEKYRNLWAPICLHACANATAITLGALLEGMELPAGIMLGMAFVELAAVYGLYRWIENEITRESLKSEEK